MLALLLLMGTASAATSDAVDVEMTVGNEAPVVSAVFLEDWVSTPSDQIQLTAGDETVFYGEFKITDSNSYEDVLTDGSIDVVVYGPGQDETCTDNTVDCFTATVDPNAWVESVDNITVNISESRVVCMSQDHDQDWANFICKGSLPFTTNPGNLTLWAKATDGSSLSHSATDSSEVQELVAVAVDQASIDFGIIDLGNVAPADTGDSDKSASYNNLGNVDISLETDAQASDFTCTIGTLPVGNLRYDMDAATVWDSMTAMTTTPAGVVASDLAKGTDPDVLQTDDLYFRLKLPTGSSVSGTCTNSMVLYALGSGAPTGGGGEENASYSPDDFTVTGEYSGFTATPLSDIYSDDGLYLSAAGNSGSGSNFQVTGTFTLDAGVATNATAMTWNTQVNHNLYQDAEGTPTSCQATVTVHAYEEGVGWSGSLASLSVTENDQDFAVSVPSSYIQSDGTVDVRTDTTYTNCDTDTLWQNYDVSELVVTHST